MNYILILYISLQDIFRNINLNGVLVIPSNYVF